MIADQDRSGWFGASDTAIIMGGWSTKTFERWWQQKLGLQNRHYTNSAMNAGTYYEHAILDFIGAPRKDFQIRIPELCLRVNYDGDGPGMIAEVKTHRADRTFKVSRAYWQQVQVQSWAKLREEGYTPRAVIYAYGLTEEDYRNFFREIDPGRLTEHPVAFDAVWIEEEYLPRLRYLAKTLKRGAWPHASDL